MSIAKIKKRIVPVVVQDSRNNIPVEETHKPLQYYHSYLDSLHEADKDVQAHLDAKAKKLGYKDVKTKARKKETKKKQ